MMLLHSAEDDKTISVDGSSKAPNRAVIDFFAEKSSRISGYRAATVPSTPATLAYVLERYGTFKLSQVLEPVIQLAREGYEISALQNRLQRRELKALKKRGAGSTFLRNGERSFPVGTIFKQPALADTLQLLARKGIKAFYRGKIADLIHEDMQRNGGFIQKDDLARIPYPIERDPVSSRFGNMFVHTMPPPGAGRPLIEILNIFENFQ